MPLVPLVVLAEVDEPDDSVREDDDHNWDHNDDGLLDDLLETVLPSICPLSS